MNTLNEAMIHLIKEALYDIKRTAGEPFSSILDETREEKVQVDIEMLNALTRILRGFFDIKSYDDLAIDLGVSTNTLFYGLKDTSGYWNPLLIRSYVNYLNRKVNDLTFLTHIEQE